MLNLTLILNVVAVFAASTAVALVDTYGLTACALAFAAGIAVTISSRYAFGVTPEQP